jgi:hypothetical protein
VITLLNVLTPIGPGREGDLEDELAALARIDSPLAGIGSVHFARWVIIGSVRGNFPRLSSRRRQLRMKYLLLTAAVDGAFEDFIEQLRTTVADFTDAVWRPCVGYPGRADRDAFHTYFAHNRLDVPNSYIAYQNPVSDVRQALDLSSRHLRLAQQIQATGADPLDAFRKEFQ